jgi:hypothetical protein
MDKLPEIEVKIGENGNFTVKGDQLVFQSPHYESYQCLSILGHELDGVMLLGNGFVQDRSLHFDYEEMVLSIQKETNCFGLSKNVFTESYTEKEIKLLNFVFYCKNNFPLRIFPLRIFPLRIFPLMFFLAFQISDKVSCGWSSVPNSRHSHPQIDLRLQETKEEA